MRQANILLSPLIVNLLPFNLSSYLSNPYLQGLIAVLMWSTIAVGFKLGLGHVEPFQLLWLGCCCSWALFSVFVFCSPSQTFQRADIGKAALFGLLNPLLYYVVLLTAYDLLPAHVAQPLNYTWAIVTALLAVPLLRQRLRRMTILGILVSYGGVLVLITKGQWSLSSDLSLLGIFLALLSTVIWALYWIWSTSVRMQPWWFMWFGFAVATPLVTLLCLFTDGLPKLNWTNLGFGLWIGWLEMGFAFLLWQRAVSTADSIAKVSQLIFLSPVVSLGLIYWILEESIHVSAIFGIALILAGLIVVNRQRINPISPDEGS